MNDLVRICPLCGTHNPPDETFCSCGTLLADVDFTHVGIKPAEVEAVSPPSPDNQFVLCPHEDCAQPNPIGATRCVYCNREMTAPDAPADPLAEQQSVLPPTLRAQFRVLELLPTAGGQADLVLAETPQHEQRVIKLYRKGIAPNWDLLGQLPDSPYRVKLFQHGVVDDTGYEVMEYCAAGTLRNLLSHWPQSNDTVRRLMEQLSTMLVALHGKQILHRDLKPENILIRQLAPLEIALTDFGASSLKMATQYFTKGARTAHYAAPEVLTGVLDEKSDWWALGMILLETITGRHPYEDLSEQVALHQLATKSVDVQGVMDDDLRMLCRGLLLRNPSKRWGADEVSRWLAGDPRLTMPDDAGEGAAVRPYTLKKSQCTTRNDLALALARYWEEGKKDLARGTITQWVEQDLRDFNLARDIQDVMARHELSDDGRLLRVILCALPGMPPIWQGKVITQAALVRAAMLALEGHRESRLWLFSIYREGVFKVLGDNGNTDMLAFSQTWKSGVEQYRQLWARSKELEESWRHRPLRTYPGEVVDVDDLLYLASMRMNVPALEAFLPELVLSLYVPDFTQSAEQSVLAAYASTATTCQWFVTLIDETTDKSPVFWCVMQRLLPFAVDDGQKEHGRQREAVRNADTNISHVITKLGNACAKLLEFKEVQSLAEQECTTLNQAVSNWIELSTWIKGLDHDHAELHKTTQQMDTVNSQMFGLQTFLNQHQHLLEINYIWTNPSRLILSATFLSPLLLYSFTLTMLVLLVLATGVYWRKQLAVQSQVTGLVRLRRVLLSVQKFKDGYLKQGSETT
ncbi:MAG: inactive serine/threonine-protein kinase VRK3 [Gallionella sp.]|nr:inactive serine/threonine-protein kinase VRK3 [Gallionella sp.]MDD4959860.1 inactive serine/threonine-protein kinase VRK3 [Gallionella sp.]